jgi:outer membrane protein
MTRLYSRIAGALALATLIGGLPLAVQAQARPLKIGFVDAPRLLAESPQAEAASRQLQNEFGAKQRDLLGKQKALQDRAEKLKKDAAVMGAEERRNAEATFRKDERDFARLADELNEDSGRRRNELLGKVRVEVGGEVVRYGKQNGYDLIVQDAAYVDPALDVTAQVLAALKAKAGAPAAPAARPPAKP